MGANKILNMVSSEIGSQVKNKMADMLENKLNTPKTANPFDNKLKGIFTDRG